MSGKPAACTSDWSAHCSVLPEYNATMGCFTDKDTNTLNRTNTCREIKTDTKTDTKTGIKTDIKTDMETDVSNCHQDSQTYMWKDGKLVAGKTLAEVESSSNSPLECRNPCGKNTGKTCSADQLRFACPPGTNNCPIDLFGVMCGEMTVDQCKHDGALTQCPETCCAHTTASCHGNTEMRHACLNKCNDMIKAKDPDHWKSIIEKNARLGIASEVFVQGPVSDPNDVYMDGYMDTQEARAIAKEFNQTIPSGGCNVFDIVTKCTDLTIVTDKKTFADHCPYTCAAANRPATVTVAPPTGSNIDTWNGLRPVEKGWSYDTTTNTGTISCNAAEENRNICDEWREKPTCKDPGPAKRCRDNTTFKTDCPHTCLSATNPTIGYTSKKHYDSPGNDLGAAWAGDDNNKSYTETTSHYEQRAHDCAERCNSTDKCQGFVQWNTGWCYFKTAIGKLEDKSTWGDKLDGAEADGDYLGVFNEDIGRYAWLPGWTVWSKNPLLR